MTSPATNHFFPTLDGPAQALVVGASGGIGLALTAQLLAHPHIGHVTAAARHATDSAGLAELKAKHPTRLTITSADITDSVSLQSLAASLPEPVLHLVINATGLLHGPELSPEKSLSAITGDNLQQVFAVNAFGPILLAQAMLPLMRHNTSAVFASLSARVGSIGDNNLGGWYAYRAAKAAQNQLLKTAAIECRRTHPQLSIQLLHPGTVDSALSRPFQRGVPEGKLFDPARAAAQLLAVIATATPGNSGRFVAWDGTEVPW
ncbi:MAG: NAD(P)-dependent dehydrogenase (short-subunit alcohol dehydrogenase family) [Burkholderiaceae bacterium]|jgi:NAD(P)-dependent dehydrogenase (short-subunit alcohol dehydrogenase family)